MIVYYIKRPMMNQVLLGSCRQICLHLKSNGYVIGHSFLLVRSQGFLISSLCHSGGWPLNSASWKLNTLRPAVLWLELMGDQTLGPSTAWIPIGKKPRGSPGPSTAWILQGRSHVALQQVFRFSSESGIFWKSFSDRLCSMLLCGGSSTDPQTEGNKNF